MDGNKANTTTSHTDEDEVEDISQSSSDLNIDLQLDCQTLKFSCAGKNGVENVGENMCLSSTPSYVKKKGAHVDGEQVSHSLNNSSVDKQGMGMNVEHECQMPEVSSIDKHGMEKDRGQEWQSSDDQLDCVSGSGQSLRKGDCEKYDVPELGMEFESEELAYECYSRYAAFEGFSIRRDFVNKSRTNGVVVSRRYTCSKQGYRPSKREEAKMKKPGKDTRTGCLAHMTISRQSNSKYRVIHFKTKHNHEFATPLPVHMLLSQKRSTFAQAVEAQLNNNTYVIDGMPKLGMGFDTEDQAYEYYNVYAGKVGFSVRKDYVNKSKVDGAVSSRRFTCYREGFPKKDKKGFDVKRPRKETRNGCLAQLIIIRQSDGKYHVTHFEGKHNHELVPPGRIGILRSQKRFATAQGVEESSSGSTYDTVGDGESLVHNPVDFKSTLPEKRKNDMMRGESEAILHYLQNKKIKDPSFFYAVQLDAEGQMANVFWADAKMQVDFGYFGDVVCFDTTCKLDKDCRPFTPFIGVNHHKQMLIFGAALLYDDTFETFEWLFRTFLEVMSQRKPKTILTDQDAVLAEAIKVLLPEVHHRLCAWHVYQKALKLLTQVTLGSDSFPNDLRKSIFNHEEDDDFTNAWKAMLDKYGLWENEWLNDIFREREKWALPYGRQLLCADIKSAQLSESFLPNLWKYLKSYIDVLLCFKQFGKLLNDWRYKEIEANYDMNKQMPRLMGDVIMLKRARHLYTPKIFELFQQEYENCLNFVVNQCNKNAQLVEYKVSTYGQGREYTVTFNSSEDSVVCSCMKFQFVGILCSHVIKVLDYRNVKVLPTQYVLKRWTKGARA